MAPMACAARGADHLRPAGQIQRADRDEGQRFQHLSRDPADSCAQRRYSPAALFFFDQLYIPHTNREQEILRNEIKGKPAQTYLQADRKWIFGQSNEIYYYRVFDPDSNPFGGISIFEFDPNTFQLTRRIHAERAHWEEGLHKWVFEQGWSRTLQGSSIQDYRTFDVATFNELREDPSYFKKEVKQSSEMNYEELRRYIDDLQQSGFDTVRLKVHCKRRSPFRSSRS